MTPKSKEGKPTDSNPLNIPLRKFSRKKGKVPVFVYLRLSPTNIKGVDEDGTRDFSRQEKSLKNYIENELGDGYYIADQFVDILSGQDANRKEYKKLIAGLKMRKAKVVLASSMSRWGRNLPEFLNSIKEIRNLDVELRLVRNHLVINNEVNPTQELMMQIWGAIAEFEATIASERVREKVEILRENPFWWTGQKPKIYGENWKRFVALYYAKKFRNGGTGHKMFDEDGKRMTSFQYTLDDIAKEFGMSKGAVSDVSNKYVRAGILIPRHPKMKSAQNPEKVDFLGLPSHSKDSGRKKGSHSILHPFYWSEEIKREVAKKFGNYKSIEKFSNREKTLAAWEFGKRAYLGWMRAFVRNAIDNSEIALHHPKMVGAMGDLVDPLVDFTEAEIASLSVEELAKIDNPSED